METKRSFWRAHGFALVLLGSIILGCILGIIMGKRAVVFKPLGDIFLNAMFMVVVPLVFTTICSAVANMSTMKRLGKVMGTMMAVFLVTGVIAAVLMLGAVSLCPPAQGTKIVLEAPEEFQALNSVDQIVKAITVPDFKDMLSRKAMLPLILFTIVFGIALQMLGEQARKISEGIKVLSEAMLKVVKILMLYAPVGLGAYFAALVGDFGPNLLGDYARSMLIYYVVCMGYFLMAFTAYAWIATQGKGVGTFWKNILTPAVTALSTQSSAATLPVNLEAARRIGIPEDIREVVLPVGATIHMEGSCLSGIIKIAFLFGIFQTPFTGIGTFASALVVSVLSGVVLSGMPGGGLVGEMLIVSLYGFPPEAFPIIATMGFLVDPGATLVNATGDTCSSMLVSRFIEGRNWFERAHQNVTDSPFP